jgi:competence protein ComEA
MFKKLMAGLMALFAVAAFAAVDVNKASQADLETIKGIGPGISGKILDERKKGAFKDWPDLVERVKGVGEGNAAKFSDAGLTVNGGVYKGAAPAAKSEKAEKADKTAAKPKAMPPPRRKKKPRRPRAPTRPRRRPDPAPRAPRPPPH